MNYAALQFEFETDIPTVDVDEDLLTPRERAHYGTVCMQRRCADAQKCNFAPTLLSFSTVAAAPMVDPKSSLNLF